MIGICADSSGIRAQSIGGGGGNGGVAVSLAGVGITANVALGGMVLRVVLVEQLM